MLPSFAVARVSRAVVTGVVAVVGLATVLGLLDRFSWVFELASIFRPQYVVVLVAAALAAAALRRFRLAGVAATLATLNVAVIGATLPAAASAAPRATAGTLRVVVANVESRNTDYAAVERVVTRTHPGVFGVVELTPGMADQLRSAFPQYRMRVLAPRNGAYGIGLFSRLPLLSARIAHFPARGGPPTVIARVRVAGDPVTLVVTHVHTPFAGSIHVRQLQELARARSQLGKRVAICGDFNTTPWTGPLQRLESDARLTDLYGTEAWAAYTWPTWSPALRVPFDNCLVSDGLAVIDRHHGPADGSDHFPLIVDLGVDRAAA